MKFGELEVVKTTVSFPDEGIEKDEIGTIVIAFTIPYEAYEVEFADHNGVTRAMFPILPEHLERVWP